MGIVGRMEWSEGFANRPKNVTDDIEGRPACGWGRGAGYNGVVSALIRDIDEQFRKCCRQIA